jgi:hypothetical protein
MKLGRADDTTKALLEPTATAKIRRRLLKDDIVVIEGEGYTIDVIKMCLDRNCVMDGDHKTVMGGLRIVPANRTSQSRCQQPATAILPEQSFEMPLELGSDDFLLFRSHVVFHWRVMTWTCQQNGIVTY